MITDFSICFISTIMNSFRTPFYFILIFILSIGLFSCKKTSPQLPSNKVVEKDVSSIALLDINKNLALKEDSLLEILAIKTDKAFKKNEIGFWYKIDKKTSEKQLDAKDSCEISFKLKLADGDLVMEDNKVITIGEKQVVRGLEEGLKLLRKGESATFIVPWYLGYGMNGLENLVPPYTSLIFEVSIKN